MQFPKWALLLFTEKPVFLSSAFCIVYIEFVFYSIKIIDLISKGRNSLKKQCIDKYICVDIFESPITLKLYCKLFNIKLDVAFVFKQIHFNQIILLETIHASYNITKFYGKQYSNRLSVAQGQYAFSSIHYFVLHLELVGKPFLKNRTIQNVTYLGHVWYANSVIKDFLFFYKAHYPNLFFWPNMAFTMKLQ